MNDLRRRSNKYAIKHSVNDILHDDSNREIGCIVLTDVKLYREEEFISTQEIGVSFPNQVVKLKYYDIELPSIIDSNYIPLPEEVSSREELYEGGLKTISVNAYERNSIARQRCLNHYGYECAVCNFNFYKSYGDIGNDFIHVHHLLELNQIGVEYKVDPIKDLRPVCPNCHAMLHRKKPAYTIDELKVLYNTAIKFGERGI
ncbi:HNH endonuclease [Bacillus sp. THAF10]|uniref:HNH endonuclease n=1 Tax=Bacillus sp. THAF10 TaxID=2587848 RepID=UPI0012A816D6|nr:HNH endonuclease [Bacillus sp. THAF10]QFT88088.1 HNH endonuclease [Bacillus sp. THAF10]